MLHDDIQNVERRVDRLQASVELLQAEVSELTAQVSAATARLDAVEIAANPAKVVIDRLSKPSKKSVEKD